MGGWDASPICSAYVYAVLHIVCSVVCLSVCWTHGWTMQKNIWTAQDVIWGQTHEGPKNLVLDGVQISTWDGALLKKYTCSPLQRMQTIQRWVHGGDVALCQITLDTYREKKLQHQQQQSSRQTRASAAAPEWDHARPEEPGPLRDGWIGPRVMQSSAVRHRPPSDKCPLLNITTTNETN